jgi:hypothetical protein
MIGVTQLGNTLLPCIHAPAGFLAQALPEGDDVQMRRANTFRC